MRKLEAVVLVYKTGATPDEIAAYLSDVFECITEDEVQNMIYSREFIAAATAAHSAVDDAVMEEAKDIRGMHEAGYGVGSIARELNISWYTVKNVLANSCCESGLQHRLLNQMQGVEK